MNLAKICVEQPVLAVMLNLVFISMFLVTTTAIAQQAAGNAETWIQLDDGAQMGGVYVLEAEGNRIYAGRNGLYVSDDQGFTWRHIEGFQQVYSMAVNENTVYAGTPTNGIFRSDDAGGTWKPIRDGLKTYQIREDDEPYWGIIWQILMNFDEVIAVAYHSGTYVSTDKGETWHNVDDIWDGGGGGGGQTAYGQ